MLRKLVGSFAKLHISAHLHTNYTATETFFPASLEGAEWVWQGIWALNYELLCPRLQQVAFPKCPKWYYTLYVCFLLNTKLTCKDTKRTKHNQEHGSEEWFSTELVDWLGLQETCDNFRDGGGAAEPLEHWRQCACGQCAQRIELRNRSTSGVLMNQGFGIWEKNSLMYSSRQWPTDLIHGRFYQMKFMLLSHPFTPSEDASFRIQNSKRLPMHCIFEALRSLMKLLSTWSLEQGIKSLTLKTSRFHKGNNAKNRALCWAMEEGHVDI